MTSVAVEAIWENKFEIHHRNLSVSQPAESSSTADSKDTPSLPQRTAALRIPDNYNLPPTIQARAAASAEAACKHVSII